MSRAHILELDVGNTRAKWRLLAEDQSICARGLCAVPDLQGLEIEGADLKQVRVSSVRSGVFNDELNRKLRLVLGLEPQFASASSKCFGVTNAYVEPERLGVDRWLAMVAAYARVRDACVVIDAGSAITLDGVADSGQHLGGYIVPGLAIQGRALLAGTSILNSEEFQFGAMLMGNSTRTAIENGILSMVVSWIIEIKRSAVSEPVLFVTGGDADVLSAALKFRGVAHECVPELVLDGLALALPFSELR